MTTTWLSKSRPEAEALRLGKLAFGDANEEKRKQMLDGFFNSLAAPAMQELMRAFGESRDWAKLRDGLDALVKKFPQGWQQRDAVRVFLHHVTERAKLPAEPPLKTKPPLPEADQKLMLAWVNEMEGGKSPGYSRWTLPALPDAETQGERVNATDFPHSHGLAAVPLLAALLSDDTLTSVGAANLNDRGYSFSSGSNDDAAQKLRNSYSQLQKPPTRAALAWSALERVLPNELRSGDESDHAALAPDILAWHESVKDASPADLALAYIEAGDRDDDVLAHALTLTDEKKMARLENAMIENVSVYDLNNLEPLVEKLGAKAAPFIAKVRQKLEGDLSRLGDGQEQQRKQMESAMKRLEATAKGEKKKADLPGLLGELAKFDPQAQEEEDQMVMRQAYQELPKLMKKLTFAARVEAIVKALPDFKSTAFAAQMLSFALRSESEPKAEERLAVLERTKEHWTRLLDRKEEASANDESADDEPPGLLVQTVGALQTLATGTANFEAGRYLGALGPRGAKLLREHGAALLAGQKPAPLPQVSGISSDTRKQALAEWASKSAAEIQSGIAALEIEKLIVLNEALTREPDLPPNLKTYIAQIHNVIFTGVTDKTPWQALRDHAADRPTVIDIARRVSTFEGAGFLSATMQRGVPVFGWKLIVKEETKPPKNWQFQQLKSRAENIGEHLPKLAKRAAIGFFGAGRMNANWTWFDAPITEAPDEKTPAPSKPENDELAGAAASMHEARNDEVRGWQTVFKALEESKPDAATLFFFSAATPTLFEPKAK